MIPLEQSDLLAWRRRSLWRICRGMTIWNLGETVTRDISYLLQSKAVVYQYQVDVKTGIPG